MLAVLDFYKSCFISFPGNFSFPWVFEAASSRCGPDKNPFSHKHDHCLAALAWAAAANFDLSALFQGSHVRKESNTLCFIKCTPFKFNSSLSSELAQLNR